jgi:hypothetical protein
LKYFSKQFPFPIDPGLFEELCCAFFKLRLELLFTKNENNTTASLEDLFPGAIFGENSRFLKKR